MGIRRGPYLTSKKIGKNNPKADMIRGDKQHQIEDVVKQTGIGKKKKKKAER